MQKTRLVLAALALCGNLAHAQLKDPMTAWPMLVQVDWTAYHGKLLETCGKKYPASFGAFKSGVQQWSEKNLPVIAQIRGEMKARLTTRGGLSEAAAADKLAKSSASFTEQVLATSSSTPEAEWKSICSGKYVNETLKSMDFVQSHAAIAAAMTNMRFPGNE